MFFNAPNIIIVVISLLAIIVVVVGVAAICVNLFWAGCDSGLASNKLIVLNKTHSHFVFT